MRKSNNKNTVKSKNNVFIRIDNQKVLHTNHSLDRWNSDRLREYKDFKSLEDANDYIQGMVSEGKIKRIYKNFYIINDDIVAVLNVMEE